VLDIKHSLLVCLFCLLSTAANAASNCTTTPAIQFEKSIPVSANFDQQQKLRIVYAALNYSEEPESWDDDKQKGVWQFERADGNIVYAGLTIRTHYLQAMITMGEDSFVTTVCDSENLKQTDTKIHRKVPAWKATLDDELATTAARADAMGMTPPDASLTADIRALERLKKRGVITDEEFVVISKRLESL